MFFIAYLVLNAYSAVMTTFITIIELFIFHKDAGENKKTSILILFVIEFLLIIIGIFTYNDIYSLIPICIAVAVLWTVYNFIVGAYVSLFGNLFEFLASLIGLIRIFTLNFK